MKIVTYIIMLALDNELHIGFLTRQNLRRLENEGDITTAEVKIFHQAVRGFYTHATDYALKTCH